VKHRCQRCGAPVSEEESARARQAFQRVFCDRCFDEVFLERRKFETQVEINKTLRPRRHGRAGRGRAAIAEWSPAHGKLLTAYDAKFRIIGSPD